MTGLARLFAKGWIIFCLYAGTLAAGTYWFGGASLAGVITAIILPVVLFGALGLVFAGGFLYLAGHGDPAVWRRPFSTPIGFNEAVFVAFAAISLTNQLFVAPHFLSGPLTDALERALYYAVPGQRALVYQMRLCMTDGGRIFAAGTSWCLAIIYLGSALSRLKLTVAILRLAPDWGVSGRGAAVLLGLIALAGIYALYMGAFYSHLTCRFVAGISGAILIGLAPLMLAYCVATSLAAALASAAKS